MLDKLFTDALSHGATDVQIIPTGNGHRVFERINGSRRLTAEIDKKAGNDILASVKNQAVMDLSNNATEQFGEFEWNKNEKKVFVCAAIFIDAEGNEGVTLTLLKQAFLSASGFVTPADAPAPPAKSSRPNERRGSLEIGI